MKGSEHNDMFVKKSSPKKGFSLSPPIKQESNRAGGTLGGISNGENIVINQ